MLHVKSQKGHAIVRIDALYLVFLLSCFNALLDRAPLEHALP